MNKRGTSPPALLAVLALSALAVLPSCRGEGRAERSHDPNKTVVTYWRHHNQAELAALEKVIKAFEKEHPDIEIDLKVFPFGVYETKLVATLAAGKGPDIINIHNSWAYGYVTSGLVQ